MPDQQPETSASAAEKEEKTDIKRWAVLERLPPDYKPYAYLARLDRPVGWWLLLFPGLWGITLAAGGYAGMGFWAWFVTILFFIGAIIMRAAGCIINDIWDRELDKQVERTRVRPLASGELNLGQAFAFLSILLMTGFAILIALPGTTIILGLLSVPLIIAYPAMKRFTYWPQAFLGLTFNFGALMGWTAITDEVNAPAIFLYAAGICWTLGYDTIYAHQDKEDDMLAGIKSTALKFGYDSKKWVAGFYLASFLFLVLAFGGAKAGWVSGLFLFTALAHLAWQLKNWDLDEQDTALKIFKSNIYCGLLIWIACLL